MKPKFNPPIVYMGITLFALIASYLLVDHQRKSDKSGMDTQLEDLFRGKDHICMDYKEPLKGTIFGAGQEFERIKDSYPSLDRVHTVTEGGYHFKVLQKTDSTYYYLHTKSGDVYFLNIPVEAYNNWSVDFIFYDAMERHGTHYRDSTDFERFFKTESSFYELVQFPKQENHIGIITASNKVVNYKKEAEAHIQVLEKPNVFWGRFFLYFLIGEAALVLLTIGVGLLFRKT
ncbi:MAG: hypothetical protein AAF348_19430 [Bacteroidota bacterium]